MLHFVTLFVVVKKNFGLAHGAYIEALGLRVFALIGQDLSMSWIRRALAFSENLDNLHLSPNQQKPWKSGLVSAWT